MFSSGQNTIGRGPDGVITVSGVNPDAAADNETLEPPATSEPEVDQGAAAPTDEVIIVGSGPAHLRLVPKSESSPFLQRVASSLLGWFTDLLDSHPAQTDQTLSQQQEHVSDAPAVGQKPVYFLLDDTALRLTGDPGRLIYFPSRDSRRGILIRGWNNVEAALRLYEKGPDSASATTRLITDVMEEQGGLAARIILMGLQKRPPDPSFLDRLLGEAHTRLETHDAWRKNIDYDGLGTAFFKTGITIQHAPRSLFPDNDTFVLNINVSGLDNKPEEWLAAKIDAPHLLLGTKVTLSFEPDAETPTFSIDFAKIADALNSALGTTISGESLAQQTAMSSDRGYSLKLVKVYEDKDLIVDVILNFVEYPEQHPISVNGSVVSGKTYQRSYGGTPTYLAPTVEIYVGYKHENAEYDTSNYATMLKLTERIRDAFKNMSAIRK